MGLFSTSNGAAPGGGAKSAIITEAGLSKQAVSPAHAFAPAYIDLKLRLHQQMLENMNLSVIDAATIHRVCSPSLRSAA